MPSECAVQLGLSMAEYGRVWPELHVHVDVNVKVNFNVNVNVVSISSVPASCIAMRSSSSVLVNSLHLPG